MLQKLKEVIVKANEAGIPLPLVRDPITKQSSVTLTMMVLSFNTALLGQLGKFTNILGNVDMTSAMSLFIATSALYLGRKLQSNGKEITVENQQEGKKND